MVYYEDAQGLSCRPAQLIAAITPAFPNRFRIVTADAAVGYAYDYKIRTRPGMCQCGKDEWMNPTQLRRLDSRDGALLLTQQSGRKLRVSPKWVPAVKQFLGLDDYKPQPESLTRIFLREYPFEIATAEAEILRKNFNSPEQLIANLIWQALDYRRIGLVKDYGKSEQHFLANPICLTLKRLNWLEDESAVGNQYREILHRMVDEDKLFPRSKLGF